MSESNSVAVQENSAENRYEIWHGDQLAGVGQYDLSASQISFVHTETHSNFAGRGMATRLVTHMLDDASRRGLTVLPFCPFVKDFIAEHEHYLDLVPRAQRSRFGLAD